MSEIERHAEDERRWSAWMAQAQQGDADAYARLLEALGTAIESYLRVRFGQLEALEDCVQDCLVAIHEARHTWDPRRPFRPWLFTIVRHKAIDSLRRRQRWGLTRARLGDETVPEDPEQLVRMTDGIRILEKLSRTTARW